MQILGSQGSMFLVIFQHSGKIYWIYGSPYTISHFHDYILNNATHIYHGTKMLGFEIMESFQGNSNVYLQKLCTIMWAKTPHLHFMPWISVPCTKTFETDVTVCEVKQPKGQKQVHLDHIRISNGKKHACWQTAHVLQVLHIHWKQLLSHLEQRQTTARTPGIHYLTPRES